jgi:hypothetical protein
VRSLACGAATRRESLVTVAYVRKAIVALVVLAVAIASIAANARPANADRVDRVVRDDTTGFAVAVPSGWRTDFATDPNFVGAWVGSRYVEDEDEAGCSGGDYRIVSLQVSEDEDAMGHTAGFGPRPQRFTSASGGGVVSGYDDQICSMRNQAISFLDHGRALRASVTVGRDASKRRIAEAYSVLDSLKVTAPGPSPWVAFCDAARHLDLTMLDIASQPGFGAQVEAMASAAPERPLVRSLKAVRPVITNPSVTTDELRAVERDLDSVGGALSRHCDMPQSIFSVLLRSRLAQGR